MNDIYTSFAGVYDKLMEDVPYEKWAEFITSKYEATGLISKIVCDLGCGTGRLTTLLAEKGYDMIGIDVSPDMLDVARNRKSRSEILYLCQDMREFELFGTVGMIVSACDCINYITDRRELKKVFRLANNYLEKSGLFIFDFHTEHYYKNVLGNRTYAANFEDASYIWENYYDSSSCKNEYYLTIFAKSGEKYDKHEEIHVQRGYTLETIKKLMEEAGLEYVQAFDSYTERSAKADSERITVIARERFQPGKHYE